MFVDKIEKEITLLNVFKMKLNKSNCIFDYLQYLQFTNLNQQFNRLLT